VSAGFTYAVTVDEMDIAGMVLTGARITYGSTATGEAPSPTTAYFQLLTVDAAGDLADTYPGISWNGGIPSGYVDVFSATYEGASSALVVGAPVTIRVGTETAYIDVFEANYRAGFDMTRFTGIITALDYTPGIVSIPAVDTAEALNRVQLDPEEWPQESELERVQRILTAAGMPMTRSSIIGSSSLTIRAGSNSAPRTAWEHLYRTALSCGSVVWVNRMGTLTYRTADAIPDTTYVAPPSETLLEPLTMSSELGDVVTEVSVDYGSAATIVGTSEAVTTYGVRDKEIEIELANEADAQAFATNYLNRRAEARWHMPRATVHLGLALDDANIAQLLIVDLDDVLTLPQLLPASPVTSYASRVIGYEEKLDPYEWLITYVLDPYGWNAP
jgi:hypothetical protein